MDNNTKEFAQLANKLTPEEKIFVAELMIELLEQQEREVETDENR